MTTTRTRKLTTLTQIQERNRAMGFHFFDRETMRFFDSRVSTKVYPLDSGDCLFVTSERYVPSDPNRLPGPRKYTVNIAQMDGDTDHIFGGFQAYATLIDAQSAARRYQTEVNR